MTLMHKHSRRGNERMRQREGGRLFFSTGEEWKNCEMRDARRERASLKLEWMEGLDQIGSTVKQLGASCSAGECQAVAG